MPGKITFPCMHPRLVPAAQVVANAYNPNKVARPEMELLKESIEEDGVTQPVVTYYDPERALYEVVDGFHRYTLLKTVFRCPEIPVVVIDKPIEKRMASTIRHNRARGKHQVDLMGKLVASLIAHGLSDTDIAEQLGMEGEEVLRLRQQVKAAAMLANQNYGRSWSVTDEQDGQNGEAPA